MLSRPDHRLLMTAASLVFLAGAPLFAQTSSNRGRKYKAPPPTSRIEVTIVRDTDAKPVENAAVIFHLDGDKGNMELKTNEDGKTMIDVLPMGSKATLQVIAKGYQTYGEDFTIDKANIALGVRLKRPGEQYSIYKNHNQAANSQNGDGKDKPADADKDGAQKDQAKDKPADATTPSSPGQPQPQ
jgi:hypothetical protein